jgi:hypothetical protein
MFVKERNRGDQQKLKSLAKSAKRVLQRDRYLAIYHALGGMETLDIAAVLCRLTPKVLKSLCACDYTAWLLMQ